MSLYNCLLTLFDRHDVSDLSAEQTTLLRQSLKIDVPDGSHYFPAALLPIFPSQVRVVRGSFLPHHPFIFFLARSSGPLDTPWLYLPAYKLCVTRGRLLHHEQDFSYYQARTRIPMEDPEVSLPLVIIVPHYLGHPEPFCPSSQDIVEMPSRLSLVNLNTPEVEICTNRDCTWNWEAADREKWTEAETLSFDRLDDSWAACEEFLID